ncbi:hypothetical protein CJI97_004259 [Candidozyma auris]|nr:hypothetical protein CJI97_004259 [[Candida] auris]
MSLILPVILCPMKLKSSSNFLKAESREETTQKKSAAWYKAEAEAREARILAQFLAKGREIEAARKADYGARVVKAAEVKEEEPRTLANFLPSAQGIKASKARFKASKEEAVDVKNPEANDEVLFSIDDYLEEVESSSLESKSHWGKMTTPCSLSKTPLSTPEGVSSVPKKKSLSSFALVTLVPPKPTTPPPALVVETNLDLPDTLSEKSSEEFKASTTEEKTSFTNSRKGRKNKSPKSKQQPKVFSDQPTKSQLARQKKKWAKLRKSCPNSFRSDEHSRPRQVVRPFATSTEMSKPQPVEKYLL